MMETGLIPVEFQAPLLQIMIGLKVGTGSRFVLETVNIFHAFEGPVIEK
jgi:hypothetical protein